MSRENRLVLSCRWVGPQDPFPASGVPNEQYSAVPISTVGYVEYKWPACSVFRASSKLDSLIEDKLKNAAALHWYDNAIRLTPQ